MAKKVFYRVITPDVFSDLHANTLADAKRQLEAWSTVPEDAKPENKAYWREMGKLCKIVKVTEITERVK